MRVLYQVVKRILKLVLKTVSSFGLELEIDLIRQSIFKPKLQHFQRQTPLRGAGQSAFVCMANQILKFLRSPSA